MAVPAVEISKEYRASLRECFNMLDADRGGTINLTELSLAMKALGFSAAACKEAMEQGDRDGDGALNFEEFVALLSRVGGGGGSQSQRDSFPFSLVANSYRISKLVDSFNPAKQLAKEAKLQQKRDSILARQKRSSLWSRQAAVDNALPPIAYVRPGGQLSSVVNRAKLAAAAADEPKAEPRRKLSRGGTERQLSLNDIAYGGDPSALIGAIPAAAAAAAGNPARAPKKAKGRPAQDRLPAIGDRRGRSAAA